MRKQYIIYMLASTILLSACSTMKNQETIAYTQTETKDIYASTQKENQETIATRQPVTDVGLSVYLEPSLFTELIETGRNYEIYSDKELHGYYYKINDNQGELIADGYGSWTFGGVDVINNSLLMLTENSGMALFSARYFDVENRRVSPVYPKPLGACSDLVAYFDQNEESNLVLVVRDLFDVDSFYREFQDDSFSTAVFLTSSTAVFNEDNTNITITYPNSEYETITKTFNLQ